MQTFDAVCVCHGTMKMIQLLAFAFVKVMSAQVFVLTSSLNFDTFGECEGNRIEAHKRADVSLVLVFLLLYFI